MNKFDVSIVIPVFNEKESLKELTSGIFRSMKKNGLAAQIIFIDDGSSDGSFEELAGLRNNYSDLIKIVRFRKNEGKSAALSAGFGLVQSDRVVTMDADLQDDSGEIEKLLKKMDEGFDLVVGWRADRKDPGKKIRSSRIFNFGVSKLGGLKLHDINCGLKAFKKTVSDEIELYGELHRFFPLLAAMRGFAVTEVPVMHHFRKFGKSKFGSSRIIHSFFDLITTLFLNSFRNRPLQIFGLTGVVFVLAGLLILIFMSYLHFIGEKIGSRPLLQLGILFFLFGMQIFFTGLLAELFVNRFGDKNRHTISEII